MWHYRHTYLALAGRGQGQSQHEVAEAADLNEAQVSRWHQRPEFRAWMDEALRSVHVPAVRRAANAMARFAEKTGNVLAFNAVCDRVERWGLIPVVGGPQTSADGVTSSLAVAGVQVHLHGIPEMASRSTLPPVLERPASSAAVPTAPK